MVQYQLDAGFSAIADATRRGILERLARGDASISDLAAGFAMTLTGMKKHVQILEEVGLVRSEKVGRVRRCSLGPHRLDEETVWIERHRKMIEDRFDRLAAFLQRTEGEGS